MPAPIVVAGIVIGVVGLCVGGYALFAASEGRDDARRGREVSAEERRRLQRQIRDLRRENDRADREASELARTITQISRFRTQLDSVCDNNEHRLVVRQNGVYHIWVDHCGSVPDYSVSFAQDDSSVTIQAFESSYEVNLEGEAFRRAMSTIQREGFECCYFEPG